MIKFIPLNTDAALAVSVSETLTDDDYTNIIIAALEDKLRSHPQIRLLYHLGDDFRRYKAPAAAWNDAKLKGEVLAFRRNYLRLRAICLAHFELFLSRPSHFFGHFSLAYTLQRDDVSRATKGLGPNTWREASSRDLLQLAKEKLL